MTTDEKTELRKVQAVLIKISTGGQCFFNYTHYVNQWKLLRENGEDASGNTKYCLTRKGQMLLNFAI